MFKVRDLRNGTVRMVYATGGMYFLFYLDGMWCWDSMEFYEPVTKDDEAIS